MANLVIVESPAKALTIKGYLGSNYKVVASIGHIRDLPKSSLGVDIENHFEPHYINIRGKGDVIRQLKKEAKNAGKIFLATDPDREGEAISWHLAQTLDIPADRACRVCFNEITKNAVKAAIRVPRKIDLDLVNSQQARRILDRIVGYKLSPFLWKNVKSGLSAGRVQSVATRMIVDRENEIRNFIPQEYWTIDVTLGTDAGKTLNARFFGNRKGKLTLASEADAKKVSDAVKEGSFTVLSVKRAQKIKQSAAPFTTSTMQQEAAKKLGFQSSRIMKVAQELYEGIDLGPELGGVQGLITYMRTDSLRVSGVAQEAALSLIGEEFGHDYLPDSPRVYRSKANAQDAHEAIRPSDVRIQPKTVRRMLSSDQYRLYKLIWERFVGSQMAPAVFDTVLIETECAGYVFRTSGYNVRFPGFLALSDETDGTPDDEDENGGEAISISQIPELSAKEKLSLTGFDPVQHFTEPPARYNDATLVKLFEESGIGRPSTYATIITTIISRSYVKREGKSLVPTPLGEITTQLLEKNFPEIVDHDFTAQMEDQLDGIENGGTTIEGVLGDFYGRFSKELSDADKETVKGEIAVPEDVSDYVCERCGAKMVYKNGRFGRFLACPNYPACRNTKAVDKEGRPIEKERVAPVIADFKCEVCGGDMIERHGKYGTFYACANYPKCNFTMQKSIDVPCPVCGSRIVIKHGRAGRKFYSCQNYKECGFSSWDLPLSEKCPDCGETLFYRKSKKIVFCNNKNCGYKREEELPDANE